MKKIILAIVFLGIFAIPKFLLAVSYPAPSGYVNDFAGVISADTKQNLETTITQFKEQTTNEIAVVTLKSLDGDTIENAAVAIFEQWGIGDKEKDNGVLLLVAVDDRQLRIEVGYGLEPVLTDSRAGNIIRTTITPAFKEGDYNLGITQGVNAIIEVTSADPTLYDDSTAPVVNDESFSKFFFLVFALTYLSAFWARSKRIWPGGVLGFLLGAIFISGFAAFFLGLWGLFLDWLISKNYKTRKAKGLPTSWWSSGGGFSSGRSYSSSSGGGFSGGSSGGGGSSGSW